MSRVRFLNETALAFKDRVKVLPSKYLQTNRKSASFGGKLNELFRWGKTMEPTFQASVPNVQSGSIPWLVGHKQTKNKKELSTLERAQQEAYANFARELAEQTTLSARLNYAVHATFTRSPRLPPREDRH